MEPTSTSSNLTNDPNIAVDISAPAPTAPTVAYAGFWIRHAAYIIDSIIMTIAGLIIGVVAGLVLSMTGILKDEMTSSIGGIILQIGLTILGFLYWIVMIHKYRATPGKMALGIVVVSEEGTNLSLGKIILRETLGKIASFITLYIGYIMIGFTARKQGLHV